MNLAATFSRFTWFFRLPRFRTPRWVFVALGLAFIALLIWFVGPLIAVAGHAPMTKPLTRMVIIAVILLGVLIYWLVRRLRAKRSNDALVEKLVAPPIEAPPDDLSAQDVKAMEERAAKALEIMRGQRVGPAKDLVYELPWYVIIGPPGAGKTTALHNCGLHFPVAQELGSAPVRGIGGTRTADWWFTDRAVLIDTAGRYTTQDAHEAADAKAWNGFLDLLKRYRPRQPLTGIIVALPIPDLLAADDSEIEGHAKAVRSRINEIGQKFGVRTPVYVLLTKADLLAGFTEFFDDLDATGREQVWGHTFTLRTEVSTEMEAGDVAGAFDALVARLNDRLLARVQAERDIQRRGLIFGFPQQVAALRDPLQSLLRTIARETRFEPAPLVRGFYLASGTQFGRPIDRLLSSLSATFGVTATASGGAAVGKGRSYFLQDLLNKVVFAEAALAGRDPLTERRRERLKMGIVAGGAALVLLLSIGWIYGYIANAHLIRVLGDRSSKLVDDSRGLPQGNVTDSDVTAVLPVLDEARSLPFASTAPKASRSAGFSFGLGQDHVLRPQVDGAYINLLNHLMLPRFVLGVEDRLRALVSAPSGGVDTRTEVYGLLRIYLMLGRSPGAPLERGQIGGWFANSWAEHFPGEEDDSLRADLSAHLTSLLANHLTPPALDGALIAAARANVSSLSQGERVYSRLLSDPNLTGLTPYNLMNAPGVGSSGLFQLRSGKPITSGVPGMFRRQAFFSQVLPAIGKAATESANESWVMGEPAQGSALTEAGRIKDGILIAYLADFTRHWDDFIADITVSARYAPDDRIRRALQPPSPLKQLIESVASETNLTPPTAIGSRGGGGMAGTVLRTASLFSRRIYSGMNRANQVEQINAGQPPAPPGPLDEVIEHYRWLRELTPSASGPSPIDDALDALKQAADSNLAMKSAAGMGDPVLQHDRTSSAMAATSKLQQVSHALPPVAGALFTSFVTSSTQSLNEGAHAGIASQYTGQLLPQCKQILAQGFPFSNSTHQASIDDFSRLFRPAGLIDQFQTANLTGQIDTTTRDWGLTPSGRALGLDLGSVRNLQKADKIRQAFFKPGDIRPNVRFLLEPLSFNGGPSAVTLTVDGVPASFESTARKSVELHWPGPNPGLTLSFQGKPGAAPTVRTWSGDFAFLQMLQGAQLSAGDFKRSDLRGRSRLVHGHLPAATLRDALEPVPSARTQELLVSSQTLRLIPAPCGLFGKAPAAGDFLRLYLSATVADTLDIWLAQSLAELAATAPDWEDSFRRASRWRFVVTPDVAGAAPLAGVIGPSQDRIGRAFPCIVVSTLRDVDALAAVACTPWFDAAETLLNDAIAGSRDLDQINSALQELASPRSDDLDVLSLKGRSTEDGLFLDVRSGPDGRAVTMQAVLETAPLAPLSSLWCATPDLARRFCLHQGSRSDRRSERCSTPTKTATGG